MRPVLALLTLVFLGGCASSDPYQGLQPAELYSVGAAEFENGDWDKAIQVFERLIFAEPTFDRIVEARMFLARAYYNKGEYITSVSESPLHDPRSVRP